MSFAGITFIAVEAGTVIDLPAPWNAFMSEAYRTVREGAVIYRGSRAYCTPATFDKLKAASVPPGREL